MNRCDKCIKWEIDLCRCWLDIEKTRECIAAEEKGDQGFFKANERWSALIKRVLNLSEDKGAILGGWLKDNGSK
jgi:hypothetical protein